MTNKIQTEVAILGSGPGGYSAAFRAADLGKKVVLIERYENIGGVCLNVGCIPSKAYLHAAAIIEEASEMNARGVTFGTPQIDSAQLCAWKNGVVTRLTGGLKMLAKKRGVEIVQGVGAFISSNEIEVKKGDETTVVAFENAIIAAGSQARMIPGFPDDPRIMDSTDALELSKTDGDLLIVGCGIIGLEMATVYSALGTRVTFVDMADQIIPGADKDVVTPLERRFKKRCQAIYFNSSVANVHAREDGLYVLFDGKHASETPQRFDRILVAIGRVPNGKNIGADKAGVQVDERGFIAVDHQMRTNVPHIFAIGDIVGNPMLAHKAVPEGRTAAEVIVGKESVFEPKCIPSVAYTDPEVAWVGLTENQAKEQGVAYGKGVFPWAACGRAMSIGRTEGMTKLLFDEASKKLIGAAIVGVNAGEMIGELALAIEMGATAEEIAGTIHPHPTLSETMMMSAEVFEGTVTDLYIPK